MGKKIQYKKIKKVYIALGGLGGVLVLILAAIPIFQAERDRIEPDRIVATEVAIQNEQLEVLIAMATLQASDEIPGPQATSIAERVTQLEGRMATLEAQRQQLEVTPDSQEEILPLEGAESAIASGDVVSAVITDLDGNQFKVENFRAKYVNRWEAGLIEKVDTWLWINFAILQSDETTKQGQLSLHFSVIDHIEFNPPSLPMELKPYFVRENPILIAPREGGFIVFSNTKVVFRPPTGDMSVIPAKGYVFGMLPEHSELGKGLILEAFTGIRSTSSGPPEQFQIRYAEVQSINFGSP